MTTERMKGGPSQQPAGLFRYKGASGELFARIPRMARRLSVLRHANFSCTVTTSKVWVFAPPKIGAHKSQTSDMVPTAMNALLRCSEHFAHIFSDNKR